jgi:SulP family sulfate permease
MSTTHARLHAQRADGDAVEFPGLRSPRRQRARLVKVARNCAHDGLAGLVASVVLVANIVSFAALMFPGELSSGLPFVLWSMLVGSAVGGAWIAWATSIPPLATGIDSPTGTFLVLLSASAGSAVLASGDGPQVAVTTVMLIYSVATFTSGVLLLVIGVFRWGPYFRFVPYFVAGGFLAATGWFLIAGGVRMTTGHALSMTGIADMWSGAAVARLASAVAVCLVLLAARRWIKSGVALPVALLAMCAAGAGILFTLGLGGPTHGWYLASIGQLAPWQPWDAVLDTHFTGPMLVALAPQFVAVTVVALISLVTKVSSLEVARQASGDLDREFRAHGVANVCAALVGGLACSVQTGTSRLLEQAGGATRWSAVFACAVLAVIAIAHVDLPGMVPIPIIAGLVLYLGYTFIVDALRRSFVQRAWLDLALAIVIMVVCVRFGFLVGVLAGLVGACVVFAINYGRLGVVRRHATRATFAGYVDRSADVSAELRHNGDAIQIYWLSGYIFFGSSEGLFERIRRDIEALPRRTVGYVILDFGMVPSADSSAVASLTKLRHYCERKGVTIVYAAASPHNRVVLEQGGLIGGRSRHRAFADLNLALAWCEDEVVAHAALGGVPDASGFEDWLRSGLGDDIDVTAFVAFLERRDTQAGEVLYHEGENADAVDLLASGTLVIDMSRPGGEPLRVRRMMRHTVVGEMGFVRRSVRSATVSSEGPATVFTLTRAHFERMRRERPDLASAFDDFLMRALADRVDAVNRAAAAWGA